MRPIYVLLITLTATVGCYSPLAHQRELVAIGGRAAAECKVGVDAACFGTDSPAAPSPQCLAARARCARVVPCVKAVADAVADWQLAAVAIASRDSASVAPGTAPVSEAAARATCAVVLR